MGQGGQCRSVRGQRVRRRRSCGWLLLRWCRLLGKFYISRARVSQKCYPLPAPSFFGFVTHAGPLCFFSPSFPGHPLLLTFLSPLVSVPFLNSQIGDFSRPFWRFWIFLVIGVDAVCWLLCYILEGLIRFFSLFFFSASTRVHPATISLQTIRFHYFKSRFADQLVTNPRMFLSLFAMICQTICSWSFSSAMICQTICSWSFSSRSQSSSFFLRNTDASTHKCTHTHPYEYTHGIRLSQQIIKIDEVTTSASLSMSTSPTTERITLVKSWNKFRKMRVLVPSWGLEL